MPLFKEKDVVAKKNCQKQIPKVSNIYISLCLACKIACGILEVVSVRTGNTIFSTVTDFLFSSNFGSSDSIKSFERHIYDSVYSYLSMNNLLYGLFWFWKKKIRPKLHWCSLQ